MKDEIKEILDRLDFNEWEVDLYKVPITWSELYTIRDHITNLQEELEEEKRIEQKDLETIQNLQEKNEKVHKDFNELSERYFFIKSRNEKAIEYIKEYVPIINNNLFTKEHQLEKYKEKEKYNEKFINELLNLLNGGDEE